MFGKRLRDLRIENHYTQETLADKLGISYKTIGSWERGTREPPIKTIRQLSKLFNVTTDYLLGKSNKKHYYDLTNKERIDLGKLADEMLAGTTTEAEADFWGEPSTQEQKDNLRAAILTALEINKIQAKKKFTPKK
ncbi:MAG: helix-turn-helix domain-containing protein [Lactobacillaceae bacterium]